MASPIATKPQTFTQPAARRSDHELQLVRRIDWRFLLPDPQLRRVAYLGPESGTLPVALKHFSESLRINAVAEKGCFDLVVLRLSETSILAKANALLAPGGFLYWEMAQIDWATVLRNFKNGSPRPLAGVALRATADDKANGFATVPSKAAGLQKKVLNLFHQHVEALARLGFGDIEMHWHRPNFEACLEIIPMHDPAALNYAFSRPRSDLASRLKFAAGRVMMQTGLLAYLAPCFSMTARKN